MNALLEAERELTVSLENYDTLITMEEMIDNIVEPTIEEITMVDITVKHIASSYYKGVDFDLNAKPTVEGIKEILQGIWDAIVNVFMAARDLFVDWFGSQDAKIEKLKKELPALAEAASNSGTKKRGSGTIEMSSTYYLSKSGKHSKFTVNELLSGIKELTDDMKEIDIKELGSIGKEIAKEANLNKSSTRTQGAHVSKYNKMITDYYKDYNKGTTTVLEDGSGKKGNYFKKPNGWPGNAFLYIEKKIKTDEGVSTLPVLKFSGPIKPPSDKTIKMPYLAPNEIEDMAKIAEFLVIRIEARAKELYLYKSVFDDIAKQGEDISKKNNSSDSTTEAIVVNKPNASNGDKTTKDKKGKKTTLKDTKSKQKKVMLKQLGTLANNIGIEFAAPVGYAISITEKCKTYAQVSYNALEDK